MQRAFVNAKIHRARVTHADLDYMGSITIDTTLLEAADILPNEKVLVINLENGSRLETYAIEGKRDSGVIGMNGGCARHCQVGDRVIIMTFVDLTKGEAKDHKPKLVFVDEKNAITSLAGDA